MNGMLSFLLFAGAIAALLVWRYQENQQIGEHLRPELAFGGVGREPDIGPNEAIVVDVELHTIRAPDEEGEGAEE